MVVSSELFILTFSKENFKIDPTEITKFLQLLQNTNITCISDPLKCIPNIKDTLVQLKNRGKKRKQKKTKQLALSQYKEKS